MNRNKIKEMEMNSVANNVLGKVSDMDNANVRMVSIEVEGGVVSIPVYTVSEEELTNSFGER